VLAWWIVGACAFFLTADPAGRYADPQIGP